MRLFVYQPAQGVRMADRPNVLFLMNDEHLADVAGFAGDDVVNTPTLGWLAEIGTVFTNAYTPAPICVPVRHSIWAGRLPRTWGRFGFEPFEPPEYRKLSLQFDRHRYMTASGGKEHYKSWNQLRLAQAHRPDLKETPRDW